MIQDLRYAIRVLSKQRLFTTVAVLTLALGIGATTTLFSIVNAVLLRPLPFPEADRLVWARSVFSGGERASVSPPDYLDYRASSRSFEEFAAMSSFGRPVTLSGAGEPVEVMSAAVSANFLPMLGVQPVLGRTFTAGEESGEIATVAMISEELWQRRWGRSPGVLGQTIDVDGMARTIVGVVPADLPFPEGREVWLPLTFGSPEFSIRAAHFLRPIARLRPGVSLEQAQADVDAIAVWLEKTYPSSNTTWRLQLVALQEQLVGGSRGALLSLFGAVALVLLIACVNVANLSLSRASTRRGEMAVRAALGASHSRVFRQLVLESMVIAFASGLAGILVARALLALILRFAAGAVPRLNEVRMDETVLVFALGICALTGLAFGLIPALQLSSTRLSHALRRSGRGQDMAGGRLRSALVALEVAVCVVLLVGSSLLIRSFERLRDEDPGFSSDGLVAVKFQLPEARFPGPAEQVSALTTVRERLLALPGVESAGAINALPVVEGEGDTRVHAAKDPPANEGEWRGAPVRIVTPGYFESMQIPLLRGRTFDARDHETAEKTVMINDVMAEQFFGDADPLGEELVIGVSEVFHARIIGVVRAVRSYGLAADLTREFYLPFAQAPGNRGMTFVVRARSSAGALVPSIREEIRRIDSAQPLALLAPVNELIAQTIASPRFRTSLLSAFAAAALLLAAIGVYGVIAFAVARRRREIGIQLALGARAHRLVGAIVGKALMLTAIGLCIGTGAALGLTRFLESQLYRVPARDITAFASAALVVIAVTVFASWLPARRAARIDPAITLREE